MAVVYFASTDHHSQDEQAVKQSKRQLRAARKAKINRLVRMHAKRGSARTVTRSKYVLEDAR